MCPPVQAQQDPASAISPDRYLEIFKRLGPLMGSHSVDDITSSACELISDALDARDCSILIKDCTRDFLTLRSATHIPRTEWDEIQIGIEDGICGHVYTTGKPLLLRKPSEFKAFGVKVKSRSGPPSCIVAPLVLSGGQVEGVINVANPRHERPFTQKDVELVEAIGQMISSGLKNARLFQDTVQMHDRLAEILNNLHVGVIAIDTEHRLIHCNHRFGALINQSPEHLLMQPLKSIVDLQFYNVCRRLIREASKTQSLRQERFEGVIGGGQDVKFDITVSSFSTPCGTIGGYLLMFEDIGQDEEIRRLREGDSIKRSFIRIISHELRTPLTVLQGAVPLMQNLCGCNGNGNGHASGTTEERINKIQNLLKPNIQRLTNTVNTILDVVEIENGKLELTVFPIDLNAMLQERMTYLQERAQVKNIGWNVEFDSELKPVLGDKQRLRQSFYELLDNAIKFSPQGSTVRVRTAVIDGMAGVWIANNGEAIEKKKREEVFEKFYQLDHEMTRKTGGCGLGLYLARNISLLHHGGLEIVDGEPGETVFMLKLPFVDSASSPSQA